MGNSGADVTVFLYATSSTHLSMFTLREKKNMREIKLLIKIHFIKLKAIFDKSHLIIKVVFDELLRFSGKRA